MRDFKKVTADPPEGINAVPEENNIMVWTAVIFGPDDTPWEGGTFSLVLEFSEDYPNKPPKVRFVSKVYHPNGECVEGRGEMRRDTRRNEDEGGESVGVHTHTL